MDLTCINRSHYKFNRIDFYLFLTYEYTRYSLQALQQDINPATKTTGSSWKITRKLEIVSLVFCQETDSNIYILESGPNDMMLENFGATVGSDDYVTEALCPSHICCITFGDGCEWWANTLCSVYSFWLQSAWYIDFQNRVDASEDGEGWTVQYSTKTRGRSYNPIQKRTNRFRMK